jgi:hypothetical protein
LNIFFKSNIDLSSRKANNKPLALGLGYSAALLSADFIQSFSLFRPVSLFAARPVKGTLSFETVAPIIGDENDSRIPNQN